MFFDCEIDAADLLPALVHDVVDPPVSDFEGKEIAGHADTLGKESHRHQTKEERGEFHVE